MNELQNTAATKDAEIQSLNAKLDAGEVAQKLAVTEAVAGKAGGSLLKHLNSISIRSDWKVNAKENTPNAFVPVLLSFLRKEHCSGSCSVKRKPVNTNRSGIFMTKVKSLKKVRI